MPAPRTGSPDAPYGYAAMKVDVALVPAAGRGTRMRPATNAIPKALLTVVDRPSVQWVVEEAARAGVTEVVVVVDPDGRAMIERHFEESRFLPGLSGIKVRAVVQEEAKGLGHAVLAGREAIGLRPFFVMLADDLIRPREDLLSHLARAADPGTSVVYVRRLPDEMLGTKGVVVPRSGVSDSVMEIGGGGGETGCGPGSLQLRHPWPLPVHARGVRSPVGHRPWIRRRDTAHRCGRFPCPSRPMPGLRGCRRAARCRKPAGIPAGEHRTRSRRPRPR